MIPAGYFGSRADLLTDVALSIFILLPFLMPLGFRLARTRRLTTHRTLQVAFLISMTVAVLALEIDIRVRGGSAALAGRATSLPHAWVLALLFVHLCIAVTTWITWISLTVRSWRRFSDTLPGSFSAFHRRWGRRVWLGVSATAATGTLLYVAAFVL